MYTSCQTVGLDTFFILVDLPPIYQQAARDLQFEPTADGFAKRYSVDTPHLARIYANFARLAETMLLQKAGMAPVPWEQSLLALLHIIDGHHLNWWLRGSAALAIRGLPVIPQDIDVTLDDSGAHQLGEVLSSTLSISVCKRERVRQAIE